MTQMEIENQFQSRLIKDGRVRHFDGKDSALE